MALSIASQQSNQRVRAAEGQQSQSMQQASQKTASLVISKSWDSAEAQIAQELVQQIQQTVQHGIVEIAPPSQEQ